MITLLFLVFFLVSCFEKHDFYIAQTPNLKGNNIYVLLEKYNGRIYEQKYWKNGVTVPLNIGEKNMYFSSICASANDLYLTGGEDEEYEEYKIKKKKRDEFIEEYWKKNGVSLPSKEGSNQVAKYWKNGVPVALTDETNDAYTTAISIIENHVYVTGYENNGQKGNYFAKYWKN